MSNIKNTFTTEISQVNDDGSETIVAQAFAESILSWEREFNEDEDEDPEGFLVEDTETDDSKVDENEQDDDEDDPDSDEADESDANLYVTCVLNKQALIDLNDLQDRDTKLKIRFIYGDGSTGRLVREFDVTSDLFISMGSGCKDPDEDLMVGVNFDIYGSDITF